MADPEALSALPCGPLVLLSVLESRWALTGHWPCSAIGGTIEIYFWCRKSELLVTTRLTEHQD